MGRRAKLHEIHEADVEVGSNHPAYKSVVVRLQPAQGTRTGVVLASDAGGVTPGGRGDERKRAPEPHQLS